MIFCDTGPLIALVDATDSHHGRCVAALGRLPSSSLVTTWPCWAEAMHLVLRGGGFAAQDSLWQFVADGDVTLHQPTASDWVRMRELMRKYQDTPMDLADASLVVAAEQLGIRRIFTLDSHFAIYRIRGSQAFEVLP